MKTIFGVNSATPIHKKLKNGYAMYDWVKRQKCFPAFCMRTLCGEGKVSAVNGSEDALKAIEAAKELGVPANAGIAIFAEIRPEWSVNHNWMISFAQVISANGYLPAFIGNTDSSKNFNFDRQCSHFVQATKDVNYFGAVFMATEPKLDSAPEEWAPYCPSALEPEDIHLWSCGTTTFDFIQVEDVYAKDEKVLENMW